MPPLGKDDTYLEFFSQENCQSLCKSKEELKMLNNLASSIPDIIEIEIQQMSRKGQISKDDDQEDLELIPLFVESLRKILSDFQQSPKIKSEFKKCFPKFQENRINTITSLRNISEKINSDRKNCNISKEVGAITGIIGGGMLFAGAVASVLTAGAATPLVVAGCVASGLGGSTTFGTSVTETVLLKKDIERAKDLINEDNANTEKISRCLELSHDAKEVLKSIIDINILRETLDDILCLLQSTFLFKRKIEGMQGSITKFVNTYLLAVGHFSNINFWINTLSWVVGFVFALVFIHSRNHLLFDTGMAVLKLGLSVARMLDAGVDVCATGLSIFKAGGTVLARSFGRAAAHGTIAILGIGLDIANVVLTSMDIHKGSISEHATKLKIVSYKLEQELDMLENTYNELM